MATRGFRDEQGRIIWSAVAGFALIAFAIVAGCVDLFGHLYMQDHGRTSTPAPYGGR